LIDNITDGLRQLMHNPRNRFYYAIDKYWLHLQKRDRWYLITPLTVIQQEGYSDIEKRVMKYEGLMTKINKTIVPTVIPEITAPSISINNILNR
jgi:tyrosyl-tRNA synthetase